MNEPVNPEVFGLHPKTKIELIDKATYIIIIRRKSRIIMKDARNILDKVAKIKSVDPLARVGVHTTAPVCSKTRKLLRAHGVEIQAVQKKPSTQ